MQRRNQIGQHLACGIVGPPHISGIVVLSETLGMKNSQGHGQQARADQPERKPLPADCTQGENGHRNDEDERRQSEDRRELAGEIKTHGLPAQRQERDSPV